MTTIYHSTHPHYLVYKAYVEGCFADPDNPPVVQFTNDGKHWRDLGEPSWHVYVPHRIKPRTVTRTVTYPEPLRDAPAMGSVLWQVLGEYDSPYKTTWTDTDWLRTSLKNGMCFANEADAQACYDALFKEQK